MYFIILINGGEEFAGIAIVLFGYTTLIQKFAKHFRFYQWAELKLPFGQKMNSYLLRWLISDMVELAGVAFFYYISK